MFCDILKLIESKILRMQSHRVFIASSRDTALQGTAIGLRSRDANGFRSLAMENCEPRLTLSAQPATVLEPPGFYDTVAEGESEDLSTGVSLAGAGERSAGATETGNPANGGAGSADEDQATWSVLAPMVNPRVEHANAVVNGKIYVFGGLNDHFDGPDDVDVYDPATDRWSTISSMPLPRHHVTAGSSVYGTEVWLVGGKTDNDSSGVGRVDIYDTATNTWRRGPHLPEQHWGGPSVVVGDKIHVLTGARSIDETLAHHFVLDLNNEAAGWRRAADVPFPRVHVGGVALDGKVYLIGGERNHSHNAGDTTNLQIYDPATDQWSHGTPLPMGRSHHEWGTFEYQGKIYSVSGVDSSQDPRGQSEIFVYDPSEDAWELLAHLPFEGVSVGAKAIDDVLYVFGGGDADWFSGDIRQTISLPLVPSNAVIAGDFTGDGLVDNADVDLYCAAHSVGSTALEFDLNRDGTVDFHDLETMIVEIVGSRFGDANLDGDFTTRDIVLVFQFGEFEDTTGSNSQWHEGDWNCDGDFTSRDIVLAMQYGVIS